jgi:phospholipid transport system transporter-binding protein
MAGQPVSARVEFGSDRCIRVAGVLSFATVTAVWADALPFFTGPREIRVDLSGVTHADSAGLALLLEWQREAARQAKPIHFLNPSEQMLAIARLSDLLAILDLTEPGSS